MSEEGSRRLGNGADLHAAADGVSKGEGWGDSPAQAEAAVKITLVNFAAAGLVVLRAPGQRVGVRPGDPGEVERLKEHWKKVWTSDHRQKPGDFRMPEAFDVILRGTRGFR